jgi:parallel beta-helix repeat protein
MSPTPTHILSIPTLPPTPVLTIPTLTPFPKGETIIVTSVEDSGPGTLRQGLLDANLGDTINFDISVFPPGQPNIIYLQSGLPIDKGNLTIDASNAGVILDGSRIPEITNVIYIVSNNNTVSGFLMRNFNGAAIHISGGQNNLIKGNVFGGSDAGIGLWGAASNNTITGNYIGVLADGVTPLGIRGAGIGVSEGAHDNQIGPNNTIAFSDQWGISFGPRDGNITGNTISQNSIHDNGQRGIALNGSNNSLAAPLLFDFDLEAGTLVGAACAQCTVEIFSDSGNEGAVYEGQAVADENGMFTYDNGTAFWGPFLTAIATDVNGNSSEFSPHTFGLRRSLTLQEGNDHLIAPMVTRPYQELADNRISTFHLVDPTSQYFGLLEVEQLGTKWIRLSMDHMEWEPAIRDGWYSQFEINNIQSSAISLLAENGAKIIYVLVHWDEDIHAESPPNYGNEEEVQLFLDYTRLIVSHFKGRIQYYEILNEGLAYVEVEDYINLIHRVIPVIHEEDPDAKILVGGATALRHEYSRDYLFDVLQSDVMPLVDIIGFHPMYGESPQYDETRGYYYNYPALVQEIKDVATAHGFRGEYVASEMLWRTPANPYLLEQTSEYTDTVAAKYYARAIVMNLGMDVVAGITGEILEIPINRETVRNLGNVMAGARAMDLPIVVQSEATNIRNHSFSLPNGDKLIALWSDGVAADYDPGIASTVILPGYSGQTVTGIDILYGFEQELVSSNENGNLIISGFLINDYPIVIRLSK